MGCHCGIELFKSREFEWERGTVRKRKNYYNIQNKLYSIFYSL